MSKKLDKLVDALPSGLTEAGIEEVASLIDEVVEERVAEEVKLIEAKVKAFLRTKLDDLKEAARRELESDEKLLRANKVYEAIKTIVAADLDTGDFENAAATYEAENETDRKSTRLNSSHVSESRMPSSA